MTAAEECRHKHLKTQLPTLTRSELCPQSMTQQLFMQSHKFPDCCWLRNLITTFMKHLCTTRAARSLLAVPSSSILQNNFSAMLCVQRRTVPAQAAPRISGTDKYRQVCLYLQRGPCDKDLWQENASLRSTRELFLSSSSSKSQYPSCLPISLSEAALLGGYSPKS